MEDLGRPDGDARTRRPTRGWPRRARVAIERAWGGVLERGLGHRPKVVDTCMVFNELDVLELRFAELAPVVDRFVVVEAAFTHTGARKPLFLEDHLDRFAPWREKLVHHVVRDCPLAAVRTLEDRLFLERTQRDAIATALLPLGLASRDVILVSDVDEIPRAAAIPTLSHRLAGVRYAVFVQRYFDRYVNQAWPDGRQPWWLGTVACRYDTLRRGGPHHVRRGGARAGIHVGREFYNPDWEYVADGGWHLTWMGGAEASWTKAQNVYEMLPTAKGLRDLGPRMEIRTFPANVTREECRALQARYLEQATHVSFTPLDFDRFEIEQDVPASLRANRDRYRRLFFFTSGV
jgi:hypothetical protein